MRSAQSVLDLIKAILRIEDSQFDQTTEFKSIWVLESDRLNSSGSCIMGEQQELLKQQMVLDAALCTERTMA